MKQKIPILVFLAFLIFQKSFSQLTQGDTISNFRSIIPIDRQSLLSNVDLIANMQFAHRTDWNSGDWQSSKFKMEQFRLEFRGYITKNIFFRFRHRYTSSFEPQSEDKIIKGVDHAYVNIKLDPKWSLTLGKMSGNLGGFEFDQNPINIYQYSDLIDNLDNFLSGVAARYEVTRNHAFTLQLMNARTKSIEEVYGEDFIMNEGIKPAKAPWAGVVNWHGKFFDGKLFTRWHYSVYNDAEDEFQSNITLGQQINLDKWRVSYDFKLSMEDIDRTGIISNLISSKDQRITLRHTRYQSHWVSIQHRLNKKWQLSLTTFVDLSSVEDDYGDYKKVRNAYTYIPAIEFFPFDDYNLKFFVSYVGRAFQHTDFSKETLGLSNYDTGRLSFGLSTPLKFL